MENFGAGATIGGLEIALWCDGHDGAGFVGNLKVGAALHLGPDAKGDDFSDAVEGEVLAFADLDIAGFGVFFDNDHGTTGADFIDAAFFGFAGFFRGGGGGA